MRAIIMLFNDDMNLVVDYWTLYNAKLKHGMYKNFYISRINEDSIEILIEVGERVQTKTIYFEDLEKIEEAQ